MRQSCLPAFFYLRYLSKNKSRPLTMTYDTCSSWTTLVYNVIHECLYCLVIFYTIDITKREKEKFKQIRIVNIIVYHRNEGRMKKSVKRITLSRYFFVFVVTSLYAMLQQSDISYNNYSLQHSFIIAYLTIAYNTYIYAYVA